MEDGGTTAGRIKQRGRKNVKMGIRRDIRRGISERCTSDGFVTKGDGLRSITHKEEYHTLFWGAVFLWVIPYAALSGFSSLRCLVFQPYTSAT